MMANQILMEKKYFMIFKVVGCFEHMVEDGILKFGAVTETQLVLSYSFLVSFHVLLAIGHYYVHHEIKLHLKLILSSFIVGPPAPPSYLHTSSYFSSLGSKVKYAVKKEEAERSLGMKILHN